MPRSPLQELAPHPATEDERDALALNARAAAIALVSHVREDDPRRVWSHLQQLQPTQLLALAITLAAMVPDDRTPEQLLGWTYGLVAS